MPQTWKNWSCQFGIISLVGMGGAIGIVTPTMAQVQADPTLGTLVNNSASAACAGATCTVTGGTPSAPNGRNLFHSFARFSPDGQTVNFAPPTGVQNLFVRVTSGTESRINGQIQASTNLFLMNPNGIIFGPNASLNVAGSFVATTANAIGFGGGLFHAVPVAGENPSLLSVNPNALFFNQVAAQPIVNRSVVNLNVPNSDAKGLAVPNGQSLLLVGGEILLEGGGLFAPGGRVELAGISGGGVVQLAPDTATPQLLPAQIPRSNVILTNGASVDVRAGGGGDIFVHAQDVRLDGTSALRAGIAPNQGLAISQAGDVAVDAIGTVRLSGATGLEQRTEISNSVGARGATAEGRAGQITIKAARLEVTDGAQIIASLHGTGKAGDITINADQIFFTGQRDVPGGVSSSLAYSRIENDSQGFAGTITIENPSILSVTDGAFLSTSNDGLGSAGTITINAPNGEIQLAGVGDVASGIYSQVLQGAIGLRGEIDITARRLTITDGAVIRTSTRGTGSAGKITIKVPNGHVTLTGAGRRGASGISSQVLAGATGLGGKIDITAQTLTVTNGAAINTSTRGTGPGGTITIENTRQVFVQNGGRVSAASIEPDPDPSSPRLRSGDAGNVVINNARQVFVQNGGQVSAAAIGPDSGAAGTLNITGAELVQVEGNGSEINFDTQSGRVLAATAILNISTDRLIVQNGGKVSAKTTGATDAGRLTVNNAQLVQVDGPGSGLFFNSESSGDAQGIGIGTEQLTVQNGAEITVEGSSEGIRAGSPGNLVINADSIRMENNGKLRAITRSRTGGNIDINVSGNLLMLNGPLGGSKITTEAEGPGDGGNITILTPVNDNGTPTGFVFSNGIPNDNDVLASAREGTGGVAQARANVIGFIESRDPTPKSDFTADSLQGQDGTTIINESDREPEEVPLVNLVDPQIAQGCRALRARADESKFIITNRGGLPSNPTDALSGDAVQVDLVTRNPAAENRSGATVSMPAPPEPIVEAQGWVVDRDGTIVLVAHTPTGSSPAFGQLASECIPP